MPDTIYQNPRPAGRKGEVVVTSTCGHNCGGRCVVNAHVVDDRIVRISTDPARWQPELPPLHACARGVGQIERLYHPDRLKYPMRRTGPRGSGQFERISWDEALDHVAGEMLPHPRPATATPPSSTPRARATPRRCTASASRKRFFNKFGGCTQLWSNMSAEAEIFAVRMTFGAKADYKSAGREPTDYVNSKLILMWGWSPADGTFGTGTQQYLQGGEEEGRAHRLRRSAPHPHQPGAGRRAHLHQAVDRRRRPDRHGLRHRERGPARPGLLRPPCAGLRRGASAGRRAARARPTSPTCWARATACRRRRNGPAERCGIPAETIRRLAIEFATTKPAALQCGYAPGPHGLRRAVPPRRLCAGGDHRQCRHRRRQFRRQQRRHRPRRHQEPAGRHQPDRRPRSRRRCWPTCWRSGKAGGYPADIKMIYSAGGDLFNQAPNANKMAALARRRGVHRRAGPFPDADRAPCRHRAAGHDLLGTQRRAHAVGRRRPLCDLHEAGDRADVRMPQRHGRSSPTSRRGVGINDYNDRTEEQWLRELTARRRRRLRGLPRERRRPLRAAEGRGGLRRSRSAIPTTTSSRRRRARSRSTRWRWRPSPIPTGSAPSRRSRPGSSRSSPMRSYPLMLCSPKSRARTHSIHGNQPLLARVDPDDVWMNPADARGARHRGRRRRCASSTTAARRCCR